jgi:hypothetical protein
MFVAWSVVAPREHLRRVYFFCRMPEREECKRLSQAARLYFVIESLAPFLIVLYFDVLAQLLVHADFFRATSRRETKNKISDARFGHSQTSKV